MQGMVITGPTGAIGMALINKCIDRNINVLAICHKGSKRIQRIPSDEHVRVIEADLSDYSGLNVECDGVIYNVFVHLAWNGTFGDTRNDMQLQADNVKYTLDAVELAGRLGCTTFIGAGSQAEYGRVDTPLRPDIPAFPENGYGIAKLAAGNMSRIRCEQLGISHMWARILSVYGPYDGEYTMVMSTLVKMLKGEELHFTSGEQIWDYLYSEDAAEMLLYLAEQGKHGTIYCIGSGESRPLKSYIEDMYRMTRCGSRLGLGDIPYSDRQVMCLSVDERFVIPVKKTPFSEGIKRTLEYIGRVSDN